MGAERDLRQSQEYGETRLAIMPLDPEHLFAYWEIAPATWESAEKRFGDGLRTSGRILLRLYSYLVGTTRIKDVDIRIAAGDWNVSCPRWGGCWLAVLGALLSNGRFVQLATSNEIRLPVGQVSDVLNSSWVQGSKNLLSLSPVFHRDGVGRRAG